MVEELTEALRVAANAILERPDPKDGGSRVPELRYASIGRSLLPYNRSLLPYNRSLLPFNRSLLPYNRAPVCLSSGMPMFLGLFCHVSRPLLPCK